MGKTVQFRTVRKMLLFSSLLLGILGIGLNYFALWTRLHLQIHNITFLEKSESLRLPLYILISAGWSMVVLALLAVLGSVRISEMSVWFLSFCAVFAIVIVSALVAAVVLTHISSTHVSSVQGDVGDNVLRQSMEVYGLSDCGMEGRFKMDVIQQQVQCCGIKSWRDWDGGHGVDTSDSWIVCTYSLPRVPYSCCRNPALCKEEFLANPPSFTYEFDEAKNATARGDMMINRIYAVGCGAKFADDYGFALTWITVAAGVSAGMVFWMYVLSMATCLMVFRGRL